MKYFLILFLLFAVVHIDQVFSKKKEMIFLPTSFKAEFEEIHISTLTGKAHSSFGILDYKFPGKVRLETTKPDKLIWVSNPQKTWLYEAPMIKGEPGNLTVTTSSSMPIAKFFDSLKNGITSNKLYKVEAKFKVGHVLTFSKKNAKELGITKATLVFNKKGPLFENLIEVKIVYNGGENKKLKFKKITKNMNFPAQRFIFTPPPKTRITNQ